MASGQDAERNFAAPPAAEKSTITVPEIVQRLGIARGAVYELLERKEIPAIRLGQGRRWIISRRAYEQWERTFGSAERSAGSRLA